MVHTDRAPDSERKALADSASTWMQVVFGGLSVTVAIVGAVIAYFAWLQPQSPNDNNPGQAGNAPGATAARATPPAVTTPPAVATPTADGRRVALVGVKASVGGGNVRASGSDLAMQCATGEASDRQRVVQYELVGRYTALTGKLAVSKASDADTKLQMKVFTDERQTADFVLARGNSAVVDVPLTGVQTLEIQLTCESPDSEMTMSAPALIHA